MLPSLARLSSRTLMSTASISRLVRFAPRSQPAEVLIGEPVDRELDVGLASYAKDPIEVEVYSGTSVLCPGHRTERREVVDRLLSPVSEQEIGTIRCIGLNYHRHAAEVKMPVPSVPTVFLKPSTSLGDPFPAPTVLPKAFIHTDSADYESELALVIGKDCKNVSEDEAMDYLLGYTAANDVSSRVAQFATTQWCFSKGFDGSCPLGPALVPKEQVHNLYEMRIRGELNGEVVQDSGIDDLIFSVPKIISFLSQGSTLRAGTVIITGTPAGVGWAREPKKLLKDGDEFRVYLSHGVGTLINKIKAER